MNRLEQTEKDSLKELINNYNINLLELGELEFNIKSFTEQKDIKINQIKELKKKETEVLNSLQKKYGEIIIDITKL